MQQSLTTSAGASLYLQQYLCIEFMVLEQKIHQKLRPEVGGKMEVQTLTTNELVPRTAKMLQSCN